MHSIMIYMQRVQEHLGKYMQGGLVGLTCSSERFACGHYSREYDTLGKYFSSHAVSGNLHAVDDISYAIERDLRVVEFPTLRIF